MTDKKMIVLFSILGVIVAISISGPLWKSSNNTVRVGTPLPSSRSDSGPSSRGVYAEGHLSLEESLNPSDASNRTLFIIVRAAAGGSPIAVQKIGNPSFPFEFSIDQKSNMVGTDFFEGDLLVVARLDKDGSAGSREPDDWEGAANISADGSRHVDIVIKK